MKYNILYRLNCIKYNTGCIVVSRSLIWPHQQGQSKFSFCIISRTSNILRPIYILYTKALCCVEKDKKINRPPPISLNANKIIYSKYGWDDFFSWQQIFLKRYLKKGISKPFENDHLRVKI